MNFTDIIAYCKNDVVTTDTLYSHISTQPKKVIFNDPATIVIWGDGTKTVIKCSPDDTYDKEKGLALCYMKKMLGNDNQFHKVFKEWIN